MTEPCLLPALLETGNSPDAGDATGETYRCQSCHREWAPEELEPRIVQATHWEPSRTDYCCPICGSADTDEV